MRRGGTIMTVAPGHKVFDKILSMSHFAFSILVSGRILDPTELGVLSSFCQSAQTNE